MLRAWLGTGFAEKVAESRGRRDSSGDLGMTSGRLGPLGFLGGLLFCILEEPE
jgi:hypothetical protein